MLLIFFGVICGNIEKKVNIEKLLKWRDFIIFKISKYL